MTNDNEEIICRTTPWYKKRRLLMVAMLLGFSAYFFYDWKVGYPAQQAEYNTYWPVFEELAEKNKDFPAWTAKAKEKGWPKEPKKTNWDYKIKEQLIWSAGTGLIGLGLLIAYLRNKGRVLRADAGSLTTPEGIRIPFASIIKVDKRKWDNKALAYLWWEDAGTTKKAVVDDLVFDGAGKVLDRLMANFHGELIDLERPAPAATGPASPAGTPPPSTTPS